MKDIGVDTDGVLADLQTPAIKLLQQFGHNITEDQLTDWDFTTFLSEKENHDFWTEMGARGCADLEVLPGAKWGMSKIAQLANVYVVTSPLSHGREWTKQREEWLLKHFDIDPSCVVHTKSKHIFAGYMLIDDKPKNIEKWARRHPTGIPVLWDLPYNARYQVPADIRYRVVRTTDWELVLDILE